ncbi:MAG: hypothetical protein KIS67_13905 [Verrucomicrobiae bacterium]|nr:hypothetical protein [Verrucomicrobiae bacterium]
MSIALTLLFIVCPFAALTFIVRLVCAPFSPKVSDEMRRHPVVHWIWGGFAFLGVLLFLGVLNPMWWPPPSVERRGQRQKVLERVEAAGGWAAIQKDCDALVEQYRDSAFAWHRYQTNALPPALAALNPWEVRFYSPTVLRDFKDEPQVAVVRIKIFGMHSTGGHSTPYFGLEVVSGAGAETYRPSPSRGGVSGNGYRSYSRVTDRIYEIY